MEKKRSKKKEKEKKLDERLFRSCYTFLPPDKDFPVDGLKDLRAYYANTELPPDKSVDGLLITTKHPSFVKSGNPLYAIEAFLSAHDLGLYPPIWVLDFLHASFLDYHNNQGEKSMDKCLGLTRSRGQCSAFKEIHNDDRDEMLMIHVGQLMVLFGCTVDEACYMVARMLEDIPDSKIQYVKPLSFETIRDRYYAKWKDLVGPKSEHFVDSLIKWSDNKKIKYLMTYPEDSIPDKLKQHLVERKPRRRKK